MRVQVLFFGIFRETFAAAAAELILPPGSTVQDLLEHCRPRAGRGAELLEVAAVSVNREYASSGLTLNDGDEVALLPPVSGGSPAARIVRGPIEPAAEAAALGQGSDGALLVFAGTVRDNTRGRKTLFLEYEAYEAMALEQMERLAAEAGRRFAIREARLVHRLGRLEVGETSVLILVASPHRAAAFQACRWLIDTLKKTVPIWKKEYFADGAAWAEGEPFPESALPRAPAALREPADGAAGRGPRRGR